MDIVILMYVFISENEVNFNLKLSRKISFYEELKQDIFPLSEIYSYQQL